MNFVTSFLDLCRAIVKKIMVRIATILNRISGGKLTPNTITIVGLLAHVPIAYLIAESLFLPAALLLVFFGLFDSLDGALARLQKRDSPQGMLLDASTDRMKEVLLYTGIAVFISRTNPPMTAWAVAACGASICVSYVKAKGETAVKDSGLSANEVNKLFQDGLFRFEIRMAILVVGLLFQQIVLVTIILAITSAYTALQRLVSISRRL